MALFTSACSGVLQKCLTPPTLLEMAILRQLRDDAADFRAEDKRVCQDQPRRESKAKASSNWAPVVLACLEVKRCLRYRDGHGADILAYTVCASLNREGKRGAASAASASSASGSASPAARERKTDNRQQYQGGKDLSSPFGASSKGENQSQ